MRNYWCACGTQIGIGWGPGLTRELARWIVHGAADISMRDFDPRRFGSYADKDWQVIKAKEDYCLRHEIPFPHFNRLAGRPIRSNQAPFMSACKPRVRFSKRSSAMNAPAGSRAATCRMLTTTRSIGMSFTTSSARRCRRCASASALWTSPRFRRWRSVASTRRLSLIANRLPTKVGGIILTHFLNERGRIEIELTVARLDEQSYYLTCAAFFEQRLLDHLERYRDGEDVEIVNRSSDWAALAL